MANWQLAACAALPVRKFLNTACGTCQGGAEFRINAASQRAELHWGPCRIRLCEIVEAIACLGYSALPAGEKIPAPSKKRK